jgi:hypothetical protein
MKVSLRCRQRNIFCISVRLISCLRSSRENTSRVKISRKRSSLKREILWKCPSGPNRPRKQENAGAGEDLSGQNNAKAPDTIPSVPDVADDISPVIARMFIQ